MRPVDLLATASTWTCFGLTLAAFDPVLRLSRLFGEGPMDRAVSVMCRTLALSIPAGLCRLVIEGAENAPRNGRMIVVCNHQSLVENFLPLWVLDHLRPRYVSKRALGRFIPAVSYNLRRAGHCLIDRENRDQALEAIRRLGERVRAGEVSAVIFPEGTRSATGRIRGFKSGGLTALLEAAPESDILPVVFHGGNQVFPRGRPRVRAFSTVRMQVLPPVARLGRSVEEIVDLVAGIMRSAFARLEEEAGAAPSAEE